MKLKTHISELGDLIDPRYHTGSLDVGDWPASDIEAMLESMVTIRVVEEAIAALIVAGEIKCPCHLGIGQEAVAVGIARHLRKTDRVFGAHRSHSHFLSMGGTVESIMLEVLGKADGCSRGMGGSMHLFGQDFGFYGSVPIVAGTVPLAVGAALAARMDGRGDIAIAFFGDGASEEGVLHESLNLASIYQLPVLFVCENNLYSSHLDIVQRQPTDTIARFAAAHKVGHSVIDGNDIVAVSDATASFFEDMRQDGGPRFLEAITYRWRGHVGPDENIDVGVRRSAEDVAAWKERDPIRRLFDGAREKLGPNFVALDTIETRVRDRVTAAVDTARAASYPELALNASAVYAGVRS